MNRTDIARNADRFLESVCQLLPDKLRTESSTAANSIFAIGGVPSSAKTFVQAESFVPSSVLKIPPIANLQTVIANFNDTLHDRPISN